MLNYIMTATDVNVESVTNSTCKKLLHTNSYFTKLKFIIPEGISTQTQPNLSVQGHKHLLERMLPWRGI